MQKAKFSNLFLSISFLSSVSLLAKEPSPSKPNMTKSSLPSLCVSRDQCPWGSFSIEGEFLFWQPKITGLLYAVTHTEAALPIADEMTFSDHVTIHNVTLDHGPGYRIDGRYTLPKNQWDIDVCWTKFKKSGHDSIQAGDGVFINTLWDTLNAVQASSVTSELKVDLRILDVVIGKTLYFPHHCNFRPYIGGRVCSIYTTEKIQYSGNIQFSPELIFEGVSDQKLKNHSDAWGLRGGVDLFWKLPIGFEFIGRGSMSVTNTNYKLGNSQDVVVVGQPISQISSSNKLKAIGVSFQLKTGVGWEREFCIYNHSIGIDIFAAYEINLLPQNIQLVRVLGLSTGFTDAGITNSGNVGFQGLSAGAGVYF